MVNFPNAKINLGLNIARRREDGYHDLETIFYPIPLTDVLEVIQSESFQFSSSGIPIPAPSEAVSVVKAWQLLKRDFPKLPTVSIHLHKVIPSGAGLGGGSADGAFMLKMLNKKFSLGLEDTQLMQYALELGSDCPFFVLNKPALGEGRGEILTEIELDLSKYKILLINPGIHVSTAEAFKEIKPSKGADLQKIIWEPVENWKAELINVFEEPVFRKYAELNEIKETLYSHGALYASMSGSGSSMFGIFSGKEDITGFPSQYFLKWL